MIKGARVLAALVVGAVWATSAAAVTTVVRDDKLVPALNLTVTNAEGAAVDSSVTLTRTDPGNKVQEYTLGRPDGAGGGWGFTSVLGTPLPQTLTFNPDPFFDYAFGVTNSSAAPLTFTFTFTGPYVGGPYTLMTSSHASSVTAVGGATVGTGVNPFIHTPLLDGTPIGALALGDGCVIAGTGSFPCDASGPSVGTAVASAASGIFGVALSWTLSPGDSYSLNGRVELSNVPEPGTLALLLAGFILLFGMARRRAA
jgi:hypothetical protein